MRRFLGPGNLANRDLIYLGVSGRRAIPLDGFGQFEHSIRAPSTDHNRRDNGVYGPPRASYRRPTTAAFEVQEGRGTRQNAIDLVAIALQLGASYVARRLFRRKIKARADDRGRDQHKGAAFIGRHQTRVAFNNHAGSPRASITSRRT